VTLVVSVSTSGSSPRSSPILSALADVIGIGDGGFGGKQILGVIIGAVVAVVGAALIYLERGNAKVPRANV
jgi:hypothetical protein